MRRTTGGIAALAGMLAAFAVAAPAQAGIYTVYACSTAGRQWDNRSWELVSPVNNISADQDCAGDNNIGLNQTPGGRTADGAQASLQFITPSGTTIADFRLTKRIIFRNPTQDGTHRYHVITALGGTAIEGAGNYANGARDKLNAQGRWYGYPEGNADTGIVTVSKASFPALAGYAGGARSLTVRIGCTSRGTPCSATGSAHIANNIRGAQIDVNDPAAPKDLTVDASGLLRGGVVDVDLGAADVVGDVRRARGAAGRAARGAPDPHREAAGAALVSRQRREAGARDGHDPGVRVALRIAVPASLGVELVARGLGVVAGALDRGAAERRDHVVAVRAVLRRVAEDDPLGEAEVGDRRPGGRQELQRCLLAVGGPAAGVAVEADVVVARAVLVGDDAADRRRELP